MTLEERTRKEVDRRLSRLEEEYGWFPVDRETATNEPDFFEEGRQLAEEGWIGDAGAWVTDERDSVLLIRHSGAPDRWGTPGGGHEPEETLAETARREVREETGVECSLIDVYRARRKVIVHERDPDRRMHMLTVGFDARYESGELDVGDEEILEARWFSEPPERVHDFIKERTEQWNRSR